MVHFIENALFAGPDNKAVSVGSSEEFEKLITLIGHENVECTLTDGGDWFWVHEAASEWAGEEWSEDYEEQRQIVVEWFEDNFYHEADYN